MRLLTLLLTLFSFSLMAGLPPTTLTGENATPNQTTFNFKTPNYQATQISGSDSRIETGNDNLLVNPSFEHSTLGFGWTKTSGVWVADTTNPIDGKKALQAAYSAGFDISQTSTINAARLNGQQMMASVYLWSDDPTLQVCAVVNSVDTNCVTTNTVYGTYKQVVIPFIGGGTNNGIRFKTTNTSLGEVHFDNAFVGLSSPFQNVNGAKLVGTVTITGCSGAWGNAGTGSFTSFGANTGCVYTTSGQAVADTTFGTTQLPAIKFSSLPAGDYKIEYQGAVGTSGSTSGQWFQFSDGTTNAREISTFTSLNAGQVVTTGISQSFTYSTSKTNVTLDIRNKNASGTGYIFGTTANPGTISLWYFPPESKIYSQASQDYDWTSYTPTSPNSSFGTLSSTECYHKRKGSDLYVDCKMTAGTVSATEAQISLPSGLTSTAFPSIRLAGDFGSDSNNVNARTLIEPSKTYFTFGSIDSVRNSLTKQNANIVATTGGKINIHAGPIPIQGWQDYGVIVGSFANIETCSSPYECTDTFSAKVSSTGVVTDENLDWINGNCTNPTTSNYTCTLSTNLKDGTSAITTPMNCSVISTGSSIYFWVTGNTTTTVSVKSENTPTNAPFTLKCQKTGADYKPKSAKIATSIGVPTVPGITTSGTGNLIDTFSVMFGGGTYLTTCGSGSCTLNNQIGNGVSSIAWNSTGNYTVNFSKTYTKLNCTTGLICSTGYGCFTATPMYCSNCNSYNLIANTTNAGGLANATGVIDCKGTY